MSDERVLAALRQMAWERAKAEIESIFCASYQSGTVEKFDEAFRAFVKLVEDNMGGMNENYRSVWVRRAAQIRVYSRSGLPKRLSSALPKRKFLLGYC